jgi:exopolyphosphatase/guanosine-5'-triphosphate,3'-diphosphate pyrophosphatase
MTELESAFDAVDSRESIQVAALDLGSNSFHLVVARIVADSVQTLHKVKIRVRLAEGLDKNNVLDDAAVERGIQALESLSDSLKGFNPDTVRIVATNTLRKASNAKVFIKQARKVLPYPIEVIAGIEEARLIYQGVAHTVEDKGRRLIVDIGGGSTEFIIGEGFAPKLLRSLQLGCVAYNKRFFKQGELKLKVFNKAITSAQQELEFIARRYTKLGWQACICTSGTAKAITLVAEELELENISQGITYQHLTQIMDYCCETGSINNLNLTSIGEDRTQVFAAGLAIMIAIFKSLNIEQFGFSPAALREGVIYEMEDRLQHKDIRERTADSLATRYDVDIEQAKRVLSTTQLIYENVAKSWKIKNKELQSLLGWAALLHEVGLQINSRGVQRHSAYVLLNAEMPGFNQEQQILISTLVRFHRKKIRVTDIEEFSYYDSQQIYKLIALLRLGTLLNIRRQDDILPELDFRLDDAELTIVFPEDWLDNDALFRADLETEIGYLNALGIKLVLAS